MLTHVMHMVLAAWAVVFLSMLLAWWIHLRLQNAGVVDVAWAANQGLAVLVYYALGNGHEPRKQLIALMTLAWSLRLAIYILLRTLGKPEEGRYQALRAEWGGNLALKFLFFFQFQGILNLVLSLPMLLSSLNTVPWIHWLEWVGVGVWLVAFTGELVADWQLQGFKSDSHNRGKVCQVGLWRYSRHPNYFFEWTVWVAFFVFALSSSFGYTTVVCPAMMLYFLLKVTGIPATEAQAVRSKGEAYRQYQRTTSAFVPWFPKNR